MGVLYEARNNIGYITIDNPAKGNVLDAQASDELSQAWREAWEDREVRVVVITGSGDRHFCAGHDLSSTTVVSDDDRDRQGTEDVFWPAAGTVNGTRFGVDGRLGDHYPQIWKPVIAAVNGWAAGAGFYLLLTSTDIRLACEEHARFKFALLGLGGIGAGPTATYLTKQIAYADAMRILLMDEPFDAQEALRINLVNEMVPHEKLMERADELANHIVSLPPVAVRMMKEFTLRFSDFPITEAWRVQGLMNTLLTRLTTDPEEARSAFRDKRPPHFKGGLRRTGEPFPDATL